MRRTMLVVGTLLVILTACRRDGPLQLDGTVEDAAVVDMNLSRQDGPILLPDSTLDRGTCLPEGASFNSPDPKDKCCAGLTPISESVPGPNGCGQPGCPCYVCTLCGNGSCGPGENICNCPQDCVPPSTLTAKVTKFAAWADLMPIVPPDPVHATLTVLLTNKTKTDISGVQLTNSLLYSAPPAPPLALTMKPTNWNGVVKAGAAVSVIFSKVQKTTAVTVSPCGVQVAMQTTLAQNGTSKGLVLKGGPVKFSCAQ